MKSASKVFNKPAIQVSGAFLYNADVLDLYEYWPRPTCIISDGPYGLGKFPGEPKNVSDLPEWYAPHIAAWSRYAETDSTLWFWNTEIGWATVHPILDSHGWQYEEACIWDKGIAHVAGNCNSKTIRGIPVVSEIAVRYTRRNKLLAADGSYLTLQEWVRSEWLRSGLAMYKANEACGIKNAATRKYLTACHLWYFPPVEAMKKMADFCDKYGKPTDHPYFSMDGRNPFDARRWERMRSKWIHVHGLTNIWNAPPVHGEERIKAEEGYVHANQKPLKLMELQVRSCTDLDDVVWEPFGGLCSAIIAAAQAGRRAFAAEIFEDYYSSASIRLQRLLTQKECQAA